MRGELPGGYPEQLAYTASAEPVPPPTVSRAHTAYILQATSSQGWTSVVGILSCASRWAEPPPIVQLRLTLASYCCCNPYAVTDLGPRRPSSTRTSEVTLSGLSCLCSERTGRVNMSDVSGRGLGSSSWACCFGCLDCALSFHCGYGMW